MCALFYTREDVAEALVVAPGLAPLAGNYFVYIGSGERTPGDFGEQVASISDARVVHVDTKLGGYNYDIRIPAVAASIVALCAQIAVVEVC